MSFTISELEEEIKRDPLPSGFVAEEGVAGFAFNLYCDRGGEGKKVLVESYPSQGEAAIWVARDMKKSAEEYLREIKSERR